MNGYSFAEKKDISVDKIGRLSNYFSSLKKNLYQVVVNNVDKFWVWAFSEEQAITFVVERIFEKYGSYYYHDWASDEPRTYYAHEINVLRSLMIDDYRNGKDKYIYVKKVKNSSVERQIFLLVGPPGSGKGAQAEILSERGFEVFSLGDVLRDEVEKGGKDSDVIKEHLQSGLLVPDSIIFRLVEEFLKKTKSAKILFDGFPRTVEQAEFLDQIIKDSNFKLGKVFVLNLGEKEIKDRLLNRMYCPNCGRVYNLKYDPPKEMLKCDDCKVVLQRREDDTIDNINKRLDVYRTETIPVIEYYRQKGVVVDIDGSGDMNDVTKSIIRYAKKENRVDDVEKGVYELIDELGFKDEIVKSIRSYQEDGKLIYEVNVDAMMYDDVPFLRGGRIALLFQHFVDKLMDQKDGIKIEYRFVPQFEKEKDEKEEKEASIVDYPRATLCPLVWDLSVDPPKLKADVKRKIIDNFYEKLKKKYPDIDWRYEFNEMHITGSMGTYQYTAKSDIDVHVIVRDADYLKRLFKDENIIDKLQDYVRSDAVSGWLIDSHPVNYYLVTDRVMDMKGDALYQVFTDVWIKLPEKISVFEFEPKEQYKDVWLKAKQWMDKFIIGIAELQRDIKDIIELEEWLSELSDDELEWLERKIEDKIVEINEDLEILSEQFTEVHEERKKAYSNDLEDVVDFYIKSRSLRPGNVQWKFLEKYGYVTLLANLRHIYQSKDLSDEEKVVRTKELLERFNLLFEKIRTSEDVKTGSDRLMKADIWRPVSYQERIEMVRELQKNSVYAPQLGACEDSDVAYIYDVWVALGKPKGVDLSMLTPTWIQKSGRTLKDGIELVRKSKRGVLTKKSQDSSPQMSMLDCGITRLGEEILKHPVTIDLIATYLGVSYLVKELMKTDQEMWIR